MIESLPLPSATVVLGVGIDVVGLVRMRTALDRTPGLAARVFSTRERDAAERNHDAVARLAASFAVKEAVVKSLGVGISDVTLRDIELLDTDLLDGRRGPELEVGGPAASVAASRGVVGWTQRIDVTDRRVVAVVVATG